MGSRSLWLIHLVLIGESKALVEGNKKFSRQEMIRKESLGEKA